MKHVYLMGLILFLMMSCKNQQTLTTDKVNSNFVIIETSSCEGFCPVYKMTISKDGYATFDGQFNTKKLGLHTYRFSETTVEPLFKQLSQLDFNNFAEEESYITGLPETRITYKDNYIIIKDVRKVSESYKLLVVNLKQLVRSTGYIN